jgi:hypothetical protein
MPPRITLAKRGAVGGRSQRRDRMLLIGGVGDQRTADPRCSQMTVTPVIQQRKLGDVSTCPYKKRTVLSAPGAMREPSLGRKPVMRWSCVARSSLMAHRGSRDEFVTTHASRMLACAPRAA